MRPIGVLSIVLAGALVVGCDTGTREDATFNDETQPGGVGTAGDVGTTAVTSDARDFVEQAAFGNRAEVELGRMAQERATSQEVRAFGEMMVRDHTASGNELEQIAMNNSIALPSGLDSQHQQARNRLAQMQGDEFDREFMDQMVQGHQQMVDLLQRRGGRTGDAGAGALAGDRAEASLDQWATRTLPTVQQHLQEAQRIRGGLQSTTRQP